jgi:hypothetical protein
VTILVGNDSKESSPCCVRLATKLSHAKVTLQETASAKNTLVHILFAVPPEEVALSLVYFQISFTILFTLGAVPNTVVNYLTVLVIEKFFPHQHRDYILVDFVNIRLKSGSIIESVWDSLHLSLLISLLLFLTSSRRFVLYISSHARKINFSH